MKVTPTTTPECNIGPFMRGKLGRALAKTRLKKKREVNLYVRVLHKTRTSRINLARSQRIIITVNSQLPPLYFSSAKLRIENFFNQQPAPV